MNTHHLAPRMSRASRLTLLAVWLTIVLIGFLIISWMAREEVNRHQEQWNERLEVLSLSQSRGVGAWVAQRREELSNLAGNMSLKLYMSELGSRDAKDFGLEEPAQLVFLRNLIISTATNKGFTSAEAQSAPANLPVPLSGGILLQNQKGDSIISTRAMPPLSELPAELLNTEQSREPAFIGPFLLGGETLAVAFRQPVSGIQDDAQSLPLGQILAVTTLDESFFRLLEPVVPAGVTAEGLLVAWDDSEITYFSPRMDANAGRINRQPGESDTATVEAIRASGGVISARDYRNVPVFAIAQPVENARGWWLVRKIDQSAALHEAIQRSRFWQLSYLLCAALVTAIALALFRHQSALRAKESARHYRQLAHRIERQEQLLTLIAETSPVATYILDSEERFRYANRRAAEEFGMEPEALTGKQLVDILGASRAEPIITASRDAIVSHASRTSLEQEIVDGMPIRALSREHIPLFAIPFGAEDHTQPGVLVLESDVTTLVQVQEKQKRTLSHLIRTVLAIVDKRDPHAAHHSACVSLIAGAVARTMQLASPYPETAEVAGQLLNLGKLLVPEDLLIAKRIKKDDRERIRASLQATADLLQGIDFSGPVVETIRQSQETVDGNGPLGMKADDILISARIVHVANSFVALISPRAYREGKPVDEALKTLLNGIDVSYDRAAVAALVTYMESGGGRVALEECLTQAA